MGLTKFQERWITCTVDPETIEPYYEQTLKLKYPLSLSKI